MRPLTSCGPRTSPPARRPSTAVRISLQHANTRHSPALGGRCRPPLTDHAQPDMHPPIAPHLAGAGTHPSRTTRSQTCTLLLRRWRRNPRPWTPYMALLRSLSYADIYTRRRGIFIRAVVAARVGPVQSHGHWPHGGLHGRRGVHGSALGDIGSGGRSGALQTLLGAGRLVVRLGGSRSHGGSHHDGSLGRAARSSRSRHTQPCSAASP